jgi:Flp pilus assembly protein TadD
MDQAVNTGISRSLGPLREIVRSLSLAAAGQIPRGADRRRLVRHARSAGAAALPSLLRGLASTEAREAEWAAYLLRCIRGQRVIRRLNALLVEPDLGDDVKARVIGLLADLKAPAPQHVLLHDPDALLISSVNELVGNLGSRAEIGQAVDLVLEQVPRDEIASFVRQVLDHGGGGALPLLCALMQDARTPPEVLPELDGLYRGAMHLGMSARCRDAQRLDQALRLLQAGKLERAHKLLEGLYQAHPSDPEVCSSLGVCLLEMGQPDEAMLYLQRAADLEPHVAIHRWNLAAAARTADRMGVCYKTLHDYQRLTDREAGAAERQREARAFCQAYEAMLQEAYPGVPLEYVLRGEELFARAYAALSDSRYDEAMVRFREVLRLVPRHYPSWGNLGAAYLAMDRTEEALRCLHRALELNPNYAIARENLALIEQRF